LISTNTKIKICRNIILPVVLNGCENWSVILREECRMKEFENRVPRKICGPKYEKIKENCRKLQNDQLHDMYSSHNRILRRKYDKNEISSVRGTYRGVEWCIQRLVGKPEGKRPLGNPRRRGEDNIKIDFK
jgi:hypothetical protein